jgi:hypothetical protein
MCSIKPTLKEATISLPEKRSECEACPGKRYTEDSPDLPYNAALIEIGPVENS